MPGRNRSMLRSDRIRYQHMLDSAREALSFVKGRTREDLDANRMLVLSLVKSLEIIGEAASRISPEGRSLCPTLPWQNITGMRNRLIHAYFDVDLEVVWRTVNDDLPPLIMLLEKSLSGEEELTDTDIR